MDTSLFLNLRSWPERLLDGLPHDLTTSSGIEDLFDPLIQGIADEACMSQQKKPMLIIDSIGIKCCAGAGLYEQVMDAWTYALYTMDELIKGQPRRVFKGAALMGGHRFLASLSKDCPAQKFVDAEQPMFCDVAAADVHIVPRHSAR